MPSEEPSSGTLYQDPRGPNAGSGPRGRRFDGSGLGLGLGLGDPLCGYRHPLAFQIQSFHGFLFLEEGVMMYKK